MNGSSICTSFHLSVKFQTASDKIANWSIAKSFEYILEVADATLFIQNELNESPFFSYHCAASHKHLFRQFLSKRRRPRSCDGVSLWRHLSWFGISQRDEKQCVLIEDPCMVSMYPCKILRSPSISTACIVPDLELGCNKNPIASQL